ncbi:MAG: porin [Bacteroidales bacterium]
MKTKFIFSILFFMGIFISTFAQIKQADTATRYRSLIPEDKQKRLSNIDFIANQQYAFRNDFYNGEYTGSHFKMEQFRMELRGWVTERVYFRFRHRYTSAFEPQSMDKIIKGVDMAYVAFKLGNQNKWELQAGKFCLDWGGIEFDLNPIDIYEYSDIIEMADNFMSGVGIKYNVNSGNYIGFQLYNSRTQTYDEIYGADSVINSAQIKPSKAPLGEVLTWRGSLWDGLVTTLWSYSITNEASGIFKNYFAIGQQLHLKNFTLAYDFKHSNEDLDRTGIISQQIPRDEYGYVLRNTLYYSHWLQADWQFVPKWHICLVGMIDQANWNDNEDPMKNTDKIRTAYGYIPTIEYYPWKDLNLKFFAGYVGRVYKYSDYAKMKVNAKDYNTGRFMIGLISPLKFL